MSRIGLGLVALVLVLGGCGGEAELSGFVRSPLPDVSTVTLPDVSNNGSEFPLRADDGELLLVYLGYTACPDVCPTTMSDVRGALEALGRDAARVDVAMATVDPERDTNDVITAYVRSFVPEGRALRTTEDAALRAAAEALGAAYDVSIGPDGTYEVVHTGHLYAIDDRGLLRVTWPFGVTRRDLVHDLEILLASA